MSKTLLVVDDKLSVQALLRDYLTENGYRVVTASNGREAIFAARQEKPDLILLDIMMPEMDGFAFLKTYRKERETPVILLTAKLEETDKVIGLELGADDYVTKPFGMAELVARIRAVLRRTEKPASSSESEVLRVGEVTLDSETRRVTIGERRIDLTPSEFALLGCLMRTPGKVFSRLDLLEALKGDSLEGSERTIDVHIRNLRAKIEDDAAEPRFVQTVFGVGYRFTHD
ncbi:MAG: response regulator transcription factor [Anaerolineae bacterium]|nr:response regulator transcription factor [Anaerolineae bacterium]NUQ04956.1 response regulator transcription factor [Anaerolineae bacterium]